MKSARVDVYASPTVWFGSNGGQASSGLPAQQHKSQNLLGAGLQFQSHQTNTKADADA